MCSEFEVVVTSVGVQSFDNVVAQIWVLNPDVSFLTSSKDSSIILKDDEIE